MKNDDLEDPSLESMREIERLLASRSHEAGSDIGAKVMARIARQGIEDPGSVLSRLVPPAWVSAAVSAVAVVTIVFFTIRFIRPGASASSIELAAHDQGKIPAGYRAVDVLVEGSSGLENVAWRGGRADVLWTSVGPGTAQIATLVRSVRILSVQKSADSRGSALVSILAPEQDAKRIGSAQNTGMLRVSLAGDEEEHAGLANAEVVTEGELFAHHSSVSEISTRHDAEIRERSDAPSSSSAMRLFRGQYSDLDENPRLSPAVAPLSVFGLGVDSASVADVRAAILAGRLPSANSIFLDQLLNSFSYESQPAPPGFFGLSYEIAPKPFDPDRYLLRLVIRTPESRDSGKVAAIDVRSWIHFEADQVSQYSLIGYDNRLLKGGTLSGARMSGSDVPSGQVVTVVYELTLSRPRQGSSENIGVLKIQYLNPESTEGNLLGLRIRRSAVQASLEQASDDFRFAAAVLTFGELLRHGSYRPMASAADVASLARGALAEDSEGRRREFVTLVEKASTLGL